MSRQSELNNIIADYKHDLKINEILLLETCKPIYIKEISACQKKIKFYESLLNPYTIELEKGIKDLSKETIIELTRLELAYIKTV